MRDPAWRWSPGAPDSFGDLAGEVAEQLGMPMDPEQQLILDAIFAESRPGVPACFEVAVIAPRQNLKTATLEVAALTDVFVLGEQLHVWTAHLFPTAVRAFKDMVAMVDAVEDFRSRVSRIRTANGDEAIELKSGQSIIFRARSKGGGRGLTGDKLTFDEALYLDSTSMGALLPTLATRPGAQVRYGSSAGLATSEVLRGIRDRGRRGGDPRLGYFEWAAPHAECASTMCAHGVDVDGCALDRDDLLEAANPALGGRIGWDTMHAFRQAMPPAEFRREFLGWWDDPGAAAPVFGAGRWEACAVPERPGGARVAALGVAVSMDLTRSALVAAGRVTGSDTVHVVPLRVGPGTSWLVDAAREAQARHGVDVVVDGRGPAATWVPAFEKAKVRLRVASTAEVLDGCAGMWEAVQEQVVSHASYPELDAAVAGAVKRDVGERWAWGRAASAADISPLEAATLARWAASLKVKSHAAFGF